VRRRHLVHVVSLILLALSGALGLTFLVALAYGDGDAGAFAVSGAVLVIVGLVGYWRTRLERDLTVREGYAVVSLAWLAVGAAGALPYVLSGTIQSPTAALFESVSGFTTTGATVFAQIEALPHGILFWRSLTQWLGGMGIIVLGIAILPFLGVGGMQLFKAEVPGPTPERLQPRIAQTAKLLWCSIFSEGCRRSRRSRTLSRRYPPAASPPGTRRSLRTTHRTSST
jgi:trk system potassium uptake protein TrkH